MLEPPKIDAAIMFSFPKSTLPLVKVSNPFTVRLLDRVLKPALLLRVRLLYVKDGIVWTLLPFRTTVEPVRVVLPDVCCVKVPAIPIEPPLINVLPPLPPDKSKLA